MSAPAKFIGLNNTTAVAMLGEGATPGNLSLLVLTNSATAARRVKLYDKATAPTHDDTPKQVYELPAAAASSVAGMVVPIPYEGMAFASGMWFRICTGQADNDNTAAAAGDVVVNWATR